ncbi:MAG: hypothetical protein LBR55_06225, partial [Bacteroidales bacterium]|nr:hypothetical protein [Bacteroidales bacterium]
MDINVTRDRVANILIKIIEALIVYAVFCGLYYVELPYSFQHSNFIIFAVFLGLIGFFISLFFNKLYISYWSFSHIVVSHFIASVLYFTILLFVVSLCRLYIFTPLFIAQFCTIIFIMLVIAKCCIFLFYTRRRTVHVRNIIIVGNANMIPIIKTIEKHTLWGNNIVALFSDSRVIHNQYATKYTIYRSPYDLSEYITHNPIHEVVYVSNSIDMKQMAPLIYSCLEIGVVFKLSSQFLNLAHSRGEVQYIGNTQVFTFQNTSRNYMTLHMKILFDTVFSFLVIMLLSPVFIGVA